MAESVTPTSRPGFPLFTVSTTASGVFFPLTSWTPRPTTTQLLAVGQAMALNVEVPGGTTRNDPGFPAVTGTRTSLYFPLEVEATLVQLASGQETALTEVVPNTPCTGLPVDTTPLSGLRPPARHSDVEEQEMVCNVVTSDTTCGVPGFPPVIGRTIP